MNSRRTLTPVRPPRALQDILERALAVAADSVLLEWESEGLEVCWRVGNVGMGTVVSTKTGNQVTGYIVRAAGLNRRNRGVLTVEVGGGIRRISVESYEHFGEWAYRLSLVPAKKRQRT